MPRHYNWGKGWEDAMPVPIDVIYRLEEDGPDLDGLLDLLAAAHSAPSVAALAPWAFVAVKPPFDKECFRTAREVLSPYDLNVRDLAENASWLVVILAERTSPRWEEATFAAATTLYLEARKQGWGSLLFQPLESEPIIELLSAPTWYRLAASVAIGKAGEQVVSFQQKPLHSVVVIHEQGENRVLKDEP